MEYCAVLLKAAIRDFCRRIVAIVDLEQAECLLFGHNEVNCRKSSYQVNLCNSPVRLWVVAKSHTLP